MLGAMVMERKIGQPTAAGAESLMEEGRERCFRGQSCSSQSCSQKRARLKHDIPICEVCGRQLLPHHFVLLTLFANTRMCR